MIPENRLSVGLSKPYLLTLLLATLAVVGNVLSVSLFFGVDLIFGSIFVLTAVALLGRLPALTVALAGGLYTWILWGHPYALAGFVLEAAAVYWLHRYRGKSLCLADTLYWLCVGIPLVVFFFAVSLDLPLGEAVFIACKQGINGVFNAVMAGSLILVARLMAQRVTPAYLQSDQVRAILFNSIFAIVFTAGALPIVQYGQFEARSHKNLLESELSAEVDRIAFFLGTQGGFDRKAWQDFLARWSPGANLSFAVLTADGTVLASAGDPWLRPADDRVSATAAEGLALLEPEQDLPRLKRWQLSRYQVARSVDAAPAATVIGQQPAAPLVAKMRSDSVRFLGLLGGLLVLGILLARLLSTVLTMPLWRLSTALNSATNGMLITDADGKTKWLNAGFTRVTGFSLEDMRGKKPGALLQGPDTDPKVVDRIRQALGERASFEEEVLNYRKNGSPYWVRISCQPLYREDGGFTGFLAVQSDITEHRKATAMERFGSEALEQIVENAPLEDIYLSVIQSVEALIPDLRCVVELVSTPPDQASVLPAVDYLDVGVGGLKGRDYCRYNSIPIVDSRKAPLGMLKVFYLDQTRRSVADLSMIKKAARIIAVALERHTNERQLKESASVFRWAREGIFTTDADFTILDVNGAFTEMTGYGRREVVGSGPDLLYATGSDRQLFTAMEEVLRQSGQWQGETRIYSKTGARVPVHQSVSAIRGKRGEVQRYSFVLSDITELKKYQDQLEKMAKYDALTGLPNRVLLGDRLEHAMKVSDRSQQPLAVLFIDLDSFKAVNDSQGHVAGDLLLKQVTQRISRELRGGDTLARFGGDEFVVVLPELRDGEAGRKIAERILVAISAIQQLMGFRIVISASIGIALYPQTGIEDAEQLFRQADQAMYAAKQQGRNQIQFFDSENEQAMRDQNENLGDISRGLKAREFVLFYQPKINLRTREIIGAEALIRWQHPQRGLLTPDQFLPIIDHHPLGVTVGEWVLETALTQLEEWRKIGLALPISVNIDPFHLVQPDFASRLAAILQNFPGYQSGEIELEIVETASLEKLEEVSEIIHACRKLGFSFSLDDFGTGYSSLAYLRGLPVDRLKIDMSFVRDMLSDSNDYAIVEGVLGLAKSFDLPVIAEGVETTAHIETLVRMGCQYGQGYGISRPMPNLGVPGWVELWRVQVREMQGAGQAPIVP